MRVETDEHGEFAVIKAPVGRVTLIVRRIGFAPDSATLTVSSGRTAAASIVLASLARELEPVVVLGTRQLTTRMAGFFERKSRASGRFFTQDEIERRDPATLTELLRMVGGAEVQTRGLSSRIRFQGSRCAPLVWLDGIAMSGRAFDLDTFDPHWYEGIEVYNGSATVPPEFNGSKFISSACGTIVLWTIEGIGPSVRKEPTVLSGAARIAHMIETKSVFTASQVDVPALPDEGELVHPVYPEALFERGVSGKVLAEFVVDTLGDIEMDTFSIVTTSDAAFGEAVRRAIRAQRYSVAKRGGAAVQQVVEQPFTFNYGPTPREK